MIAVLLLLVVVLTVLLRGGVARPPLDPESYQRDGGRAVARLIADQGVRVVPARTLEDARREVRTAGGTLLVTAPDLLEPGVLAALVDESESDVVLVQPGPRALTALHLPVRIAGQVAESVREPDCTLPAARKAGRSTIAGLVYRGEPGSQSCYPAGEGAGLVRAERITVLSTGFANSLLDEEGNAALAMNLLGGGRTLVWFVPTPTDPGLGGGTKKFTDYLPDGWVFGGVQILVAVLLFGIWRARRLGPLVAERLPVTVRGAETVEGRARLYQRAGATDHAAAALRQATVDRLRPMLGQHGDEGLVAEVARRTGRTDIPELLYGSTTTEAELINLATELDAVENEVRRS
ncbi:DUF4350 domain-containing protein [Pseudonocardiaceae bacterium YIM PH 21723]|nr:DUF4350 domain-containing protein [Pseudonocardiaceae bacterium YIM PH 21723]